MECIACPDGRRGLWMRRTDADGRPVKVELFAGREGGDWNVTFSAGDVVTDRKLYQLTEVLTTLRYAYEVAADNAQGMRPVTDAQLAAWERASVEAQPIGIDIVRLGDTWHAPIPNTSAEYALTTIDFANDAREAMPMLIDEVRRMRAAPVAIALIDGTVAGLVTTIDVQPAPPMFWMNGNPVHRADGTVVRTGPARSRIVITRVSPTLLPQDREVSVLLFTSETTYSVRCWIESDACGIVTMAGGAPMKHSSTPKAHTDGPPDSRPGSLP